MDDWKVTTERYLRKWIDQFTTVERVCGIQGGPISDQSDRFIRHGFKSVDLEALAAGMVAVSGSKTAIKQWGPDERKAWRYHIGRIEKAIQERPKKPTRAKKVTVPKSLAPAAIEPDKPVGASPPPVAEAPKPVVEAPKPVVEAPKPVVEVPKPVVEVPKPVIIPPSVPPAARPVVSHHKARRNKKKWRLGAFLRDLIASIIKKL